MWALGVMLYVLLTGTLPFAGTKNRVFEMITNGVYNVNDDLKQKKKKIIRIIFFFRHKVDNGKVYLNQQKIFVLVYYV